MSSVKYMPILWIAKKQEGHQLLFRHALEHRRLPLVNIGTTYTNSIFFLANVCPSSLCEENSIGPWTWTAKTVILFIVIVILYFCWPFFIIKHYYYIDNSKLLISYNYTNHSNSVVLFCWTPNFLNVVYSLNSINQHVFRYMYLTHVMSSNK
jgi:hypothetical protein